MIHSKLHLNFYPELCLFHLLNQLQSIPLSPRRHHPPLFWKEIHLPEEPGALQSRWSLKTTKFINNLVSRLAFYSCSQSRFLHYILGQHTEYSQNLQATHRCYSVPPKCWSNLIQCKILVQVGVLLRARHQANSPATCITPT